MADRIECMMHVVELAIDVMEIRNENVLPGTTTWPTMYVHKKDEWVDPHVLTEMSPFELLPNNIVKLS